MKRPLDGVKVVDLTNMLMGPYASQILGDMGADIVKLETLDGDPVRGIGAGRSPGMRSVFMSCNRSKRSVALDLKQPEGQAVALDMIADADVLLYNRRPRIMEKLGLSYKTVAARNPRIIYAGTFGYGQRGPYGPKPAFDDLIQGLSAIPSLSTHDRGGEPQYAPLALADRGVALWAVGQVCAALYHQARTGEGQRLDIPMFEVMASFVLGDHMGGAFFEPQEGSTVYQRLVAKDRRPYRTRDGYICVVVYTDRNWRDYFRALGREEDFERDPRFASMTARTENIGSILGEVADLMPTRTTAEWLNFFDAIDIAATPLHTIDSLLHDPHLEAIGFFGEEDHPSEGRLRSMAFPTEWSATQPARSRPVPRLGEHSAEVLREMGYDEERIAALIADGVLGTLGNSN
jgi:crotonobetainyl-CoA:carnitine CoA-transferase CaiB-like acyl-CoA transferase